MRKILLLGVLTFSAAIVASAQEGNVGQATLGSAASKAMNPDIALDGLFALSQFNSANPLVYSGGHDPKQNGFNIQQVELTLGSNVDPYFRGDANLVLTKDGIEIEEAYATTLDFPANLQLKAGQFLTAFGRHNPTHPHAWDFADQPLILGRFFGGDGLRNPGLQVSFLTPLPWYSELIGSIQNSTGTTVPSFRPDTDVVPQIPMRNFVTDSVALLRWNNFLSLSDDLSLNLGASVLNGPNNQAEGLRTRVYGADVFLKFRRPESLAFIGFQAEALYRSFDTQSSGTAEDYGGYAQILWRLDEPFQRWHLGLRFDYEGPRQAPVVTTQGPDADSGRRWRLSPVITFYPSEFSKLRLQYNYDQAESLGMVQHVAILELEFLIGAHGAHKF